MVAIVLWRLASKQVEIAFVCWKCQREQAFQVLGSFVVNVSEETFPNTLHRSLSFAEWDSGDHGCDCFVAPGFETSRNCICLLENANESKRSRFWGPLWSMFLRKHFPTHCIDHSPSQNGIAETMVAIVLWRLASKQVEIAFVCWKCQREQAFQVLGSFVVNASKETFPNTLHRSLSFAALDCGCHGCDCFVAPGFETSRNCICLLEVPTRASVPGFGLVCGQCFQGNISQHIASITLLRRMG
jgi:hypothetical protein